MRVFMILFGWVMCLAATVTVGYNVWRVTGDSQVAIGFACSVPMGIASVICGVLGGKV